MEQPTINEVWPVLDFRELNCYVMSQSMVANFRPRLLWILSRVPTNQHSKENMEIPAGEIQGPNMLFS